MYLRSSHVLKISKVNNHIQAAIDSFDRILGRPEEG